LLLLRSDPRAGFAIFLIRDATGGSAMPDGPVDAHVEPAKAGRLAAFGAAQAAPRTSGARSQRRGGKMDLSVAEEKSAAVPPFPLDLLEWRAPSKDAYLSNRDVL
jgi:hypothetical protein